MNKVHFIVNPIAGRGDAAFNKASLSRYFGPDQYELTVKTSNYPGHAAILAKESVDEGAEIVVACGGDGTINEVASCLVHTKVLLGIIPMGSGNGLAESLEISRNIKRAVEIIKSGKTNRIDVAMVNGKPFFSNMGIGFDATVISNYNASQHRRFWAYLKAVLKSIKDYKYNEKIKVEMDGQSFKTRPFMFFISNSKVMGYDISLTRMASLQDGLLDVVIIDDLNKLQMLFLGLIILLRLDQHVKKIQYYKVKNLKLAFEDKQSEHLMQADGELHNLVDREIFVNVEERALHVLCP